MIFFLGHLLFKKRVQVDLRNLNFSMYKNISKSAYTLQKCRVLLCDSTRNSGLTILMQIDVNLKFLLVNQQEDYQNQILSILYFVGVSIS